MLNRAAKCVLLALCLTAASGLAHAASFCVGGPGLPPQCLYDDVRECRRAANSQSVSCVINPEAYISMIGETRYCRVGSTHVAQCIYVDRNNCNEDARLNDEVCFDRALINDKNNPYRLDDRLQY